jgi:hypothetical protein
VQQVVNSAESGKRKPRRAGEVGVEAFASLLESIAMMEPVVQFEVAEGVALGRGNKLLPAFDIGCESSQKEAMHGCGTPLLAFATAVAAASVPVAFDVAVVDVGWLESRPDLASLVEVQAWWICLEARSCPIAQRHGHGTDNHRPERLLSPFGHLSD